VREATDFRVGAVLKLKPVSQLPKKFVIPIADDQVRTQKWDTCASEALSVLLSHINGYPVEAIYTWALSRANAGYAIDDYGVTIKEILMGAVKGGAPHASESQYKSTDERSIFADITKWDLKGQQRKAIVNKAGSALFCEPTDGMDYFDVIRSTIVTTGNPVLWGMMWNHDPSNPNLLEPMPTGYGHCQLFYGYDNETLQYVDLLLDLNSWGLSVGEKGRYRASRKLVNHDVNIFGAGTLIDETPEKVRWHLENGIYLNDGNWLLNIAKAMFVAIKQALKLTVEVPKNIGVPPYPVKIVKMAEAIKRHEGWFPGSRSRRNHNPGNFKFVSQYKAIGKDAQGFAIFPDDETGWQHLLKVIHNACSGKSVMYPPTMSLYQYFEKYAPSSDKNDPRRYAEVVAEACGVSPYTIIRELL
jgi:hypothetical protein